MRIEPTAHDPLAQRDHDDDPRPEAPERAREYAPPPRVDAHGAHAILAFVQAQARKPEGDDVLFVGMNRTEEGAELAAHARGHVTRVDGGTTSVVRAAGRSFDVSTRDGVEAFVATLRLDPATAGGVVDAVMTCDVSGRDELVKIAAAWAPGERGERIPSRLVLSGHGTSGQIFGEGSGWLTFSSVCALARAMPGAAAQVEDIFIAACFQGSAGRMQPFIDTFPNLATIQGYEGMAPGNDVANILRWEQASRGHAQSPIAIPGGGSWTRRDGFRTGDFMPLNIAEREIARLDVFDAYARGERVDRDPHAGPLTAYYTALQRVAGHLEVDPERKAEIDARLGQTRVLRYYAQTRANFAAVYATELRDGYAALGMRIPDYAKLDRRHALEAIAECERRAAASPPSDAVEALLERLHALRDLDTRYISEAR